MAADGTLDALVGFGATVVEPGRAPSCRGTCGVIPGVFDCQLQLQRPDGTAKASMMLRQRGCPPAARLDLRRGAPMTAW